MPFPTISLATRSIAFVDMQLPQLGQLLTGLPGGTEVVLLDSQSGGLEQMADVLAERQGIESIHLICHGDPGVLYCGDRPIDILTLPTMRDELHVIANATVQDGEWLLYGCDLAQGVLGRRLVDELAQATGLKVAAASHKVGADAKGGHWGLDYAPQPVNHALQIPQWPNLLTGTTRVSVYQSVGEIVNAYAFAAILADGSVVTWGDPLDGGDSSAVAGALDGTIPVMQVFSNSEAFAALRADGSVVTWGNPLYGGDSSAVAGALDGTVDVTQIFSNGGTFAALRADGSVVTWGDPTTGGDSSAVANALDGTIDVTQIFSNGGAFAALRADGSVVTWGDPTTGGNSSAVASALKNVRDFVNVFTDEDLHFIRGNGALYGGAGDDYFVGGNSIDIAVFGGNQASHTLVKTATGWTVSSATDGTDTLTKIERLQFSDKTIALDIDGNAGQVYRLYQAAFNRTPDKGGLGDWIYGMDHGMSLLDVSAGFINSPEFQSVYGVTPTNSEIVTRFYQNVLHRAPEQAGFDYWMNQIESGLQSRTQVLTGFSESPENQLQVIGVIQDGIEYTQHAV